MLLECCGCSQNTPVLYSQSWLPVHDVSLLRGLIVDVDASSSSEDAENEEEDREEEEGEEAEMLIPISEQGMWVHFIITHGRVDVCE